VIVLFYNVREDRGSSFFQRLWQFGFLEMRTDKSVYRSPSLSSAAIL